MTNFQGLSSVNVQKISTQVGHWLTHGYVRPAELNTPLLLPLNGWDNSFCTSLKFVYVSHLLQFLQDLSPNFTNTLTLDGQSYIHALRSHFWHLPGLMQQIQLHVKGGITRHQYPFLCLFILYTICKTSVAQLPAHKSDLGNWMLPSGPLPPLKSKQRRAFWFLHSSCVLLCSGVCVVLHE